MYGYRIIKEQNVFRFAFFPNNNPNQKLPVGQSCEYQNEIDCRNAIKEFASYIKTEHLNCEKRDMVKIYKDESSWYYFEYLKNDQKVFYRISGFNGMNALYNCRKSIEGIYKHIDEYSSNELPSY